MDEAETTTNSEEVLKDASMVQEQASANPVEPLVPQTPAPLEIASLGEAMQAFNKAKSEAIKASVPEESTGTADASATGGQAGLSQAEPNQTEPITTTSPVSEAVPSSGTELLGGAGEHASDDEVYDADAGVAGVRQQFVNIAVDAVRKDFAEKGIKKITINDLMKVDEQRGTKEFINPDTSRPFSSSNPRSEAQAFVKDYNADLEAQFSQQCQGLLPSIEKSYAPIVEFHEFLPTWQQMDPFRQEMFEELVAGHELTDKQGNIIAYNCDLNAISTQMERQIQWLLSKQQSLGGGQSAAPAAVNPVTQPMVAAKTVAASTGADDKEYDLSNMTDALKYYNKQKSQKKGK